MMRSLFLAMTAVAAATSADKNFQSTSKENTDRLRNRVPPHQHQDRSLEEENSNQPSWFFKSFVCILTELSAELEDHHAKTDHVCQGYDEFGDLENTYFITDNNGKIPNLEPDGYDILHNSARYKLILTNMIHNNDNFVTTTPDTNVTVIDLQEEEEEGQPRRRDLEAIEGERTMLIVRVSANDKQPANSAQELSNSFFSMADNQQSFKKRYSLCSFGKLEFVPAQGDHINHGILDVNLGQNIDNLSIHSLLNVITSAARTKLGYKLPGNFGHAVYIVPEGTTYGTNGPKGWMAFAYIGAYLSVFNGRNALWLSHQVHEIGHNLGLQHSSHNGEAYGDQSGVMGYGYTEHDFPQMCFNAAKSWQLGWYREKALDIDISNGPQGIYLDAFVDYEKVPQGEYVLLKIDTKFAIYNKKKGINIETQEFQDRVTISQMTSTENLSEVVAALNPNDQTSFTVNGQNVHIKHCGTATENIGGGTVDKVKLMIYADNNSLSDPCGSFQNYRVKQQRPELPITPNPTNQPTTASTRPPTPVPIDVNPRADSEPEWHPTSSPTSRSEPEYHPTSSPTSRSEPEYHPTSYPTSSSDDSRSEPEWHPTSYPTWEWHPTAVPTQGDCPPDEMLVEITIKTDNKPNETSWHLKRRNVPLSVASKPAGFYTESLKQYYHRYCVPSHQLYEFRIMDSGRDGIQGDHGDGFYELKANGEIEDEGGSFASFAIDYFEGPCDGEYSSFQFKFKTGTNGRFVSYELSSESEQKGLPMKSNSFASPYLQNINMEFLVQECFPTANCYTLITKSEPYGDYEPSTGGSVEVEFGGSWIGFNNFDDGDNFNYNFGENCNLSSDRNLRSISSSISSA